MPDLDASLFSYIRAGTIDESDDALALARRIVDPSVSGFTGADGVWKARARDLLAALILYVATSPDIAPKTLRTCRTLASDDLRRHLDAMAHVPNHFIALRAHTQLDRPSAEAGSVAAELKLHLAAAS